ncbi:thioredoxin-like protein [Artomyces pyxidatus]|uniref:Thioredoxin-like protein n=1 Tax=Artomyces pyxidatus TaxID=48021 RepID=A0ACB8T8F7_9AGAM|nr:thioredoxin-like protein [Artomyces pyxidatus]
MQSAFKLARPLRRISGPPHRAFSISSRRAEHFLNANQATFEKVTASTGTNERVVLVDFYADWCQPCKILSPILEKVTANVETKTGSGRALDLVTVNTDEEVVLASQFRISSIPTVVAFKDGKPVSQFVGALNEAGLRQFLETI